MRVLLVLALASAALLAGCASNSTSPTGDAKLPPAPAMSAVPANITDANHNVIGGIDPLNGDPTGQGLLPFSPCTSAVEGCIRYAFDVNATAGNVTYQADLTWSIPASDFDLYLFHGSDVIATSGSSPPGTSESLSGTLEPGHYEFAVSPYSVTQDTYSFKAVFGHATV